MTLWQLRDLSINHDALAIEGDFLKFFWGDQQSLGFEKGDFFGLESLVSLLLARLATLVLTLPTLHMVLHL